MRKAGEKTLAHLLRAMEARQAVTIRYMKSSGEVSRRTIEVFGFEVTSAGNITMVAMDRRTDEVRTFRLDRITDYTLHRVGRVADYRTPVLPYVPEVSTDDEDASYRLWEPRYKLAA